MSSGQESKGNACGKKASARKETNSVSGKKVTIMPKNQITMPPHLPSHPCHEDEVCRRTEVSKAK